VAKIKVLFICTANISRSRTAEDLLLGSSVYEAKSAGFKWCEGTGQLVTQELVDWADRIIVMNENEDAHLTLLRSGFDVFSKDIYILDIPDRYRQGDPFLIMLLRDRLKNIAGINL